MRYPIRCRIRGLALPLVLSVVTILFLVAGTISLLAVNNGRMVERVTDRTVGRQYLRAATSMVAAYLDHSANWSTNALEGVSGEVDPAQGWRYRLSEVSSTPSQITLTVTAERADRDTGRVRARITFRRTGTPFKYPTQVASGAELLNNSEITSEADDAPVSVRTNTVNSKAITVKNSTLTGDVIVGNTSKPGDVVDQIASNLGRILSSDAKANFTPPAAPPMDPGDAADNLELGGRQVTTSVTTTVRSTTTMGQTVNPNGSPGGGAPQPVSVPSTQSQPATASKPDFRALLMAALGATKTLLQTSVGVAKTTSDSYGGDPPSGAVGKALVKDPVVRSQAGDAADKWIALFKAYSGRGGSRGTTAQTQGQNNGGAQADTSVSSRLTVSPTEVVEEKTVTEERTETVFEPSDRTLAPGNHGNLTVSDGSVIRLGPGVYAFDNIKMTNGSTLMRDPGADGRTLVFMRGDLTVDGAYLSNGGKASDFVFTGAGNNQVLLKGAVDLNGALYMPLGTVNLTGATLNGAVVADTLRTDNARVRYDASLKPMSLDGMGAAAVVSWEMQ
ncbi:MAG: hypothetical protein FJX76_19985 [Armatimonadetes bacterium]|nr:hypothetical protein [Armatimonadota bacterium]